MKLNPDCIRDILLYLESNLKLSDNLAFNEIYIKELYESLTKYGKDEIYYNVCQLFEAKYITGVLAQNLDKSLKLCKISDITWEGHQFLNNVRPETIWQAAKKGAAKLGVMSISTLGTLAMNITTTLASDPNTINGVLQSVGLG